ncbi:MAG: MBOAT family protein [bacterium]|nr:MBOAT family protein [bacterium]
MLFNSVEFLLFFPIVVGLHFLLRHRHRWLLLLIASCVFYMSFVPAYILILLGTISIDYFAAIYLAQRRGAARRLTLYAAVALNFGVLFAFKYFNFFNANVGFFANWFGITYSPFLLEVVLPIGLSFHTFQSVSYLIDVHRGTQPVERHPGMLALYVMFFPQLVAGPIERPQNLLPQLRAEQHFDFDRAVSGLKLMAWGFFKKLVIADRLAIYVDAIYNQPGDFAGAPLVLATYLFAFQIYCDFSGYSDIAIGAARVLGFRLMDNFRTPYFSTGIAEFWRRWHISLSTWFRDYVYIPLGGSRGAAWRVSANLLIVFLVSGLWHGASWNFVIWGGIHGLLLIGERAIGGLRARLPGGATDSDATTSTAQGPSTKQTDAPSRFAGVWKTLRTRLWPRLWTFAKMALVFHLVTFAWIFFRADGFADAQYVIANLFAEDRQPFETYIQNDAAGKAGVVVVCLLLLFEWLRSRTWAPESLAKIRRLRLHYLFYAVLLICIALMGVFDGESFIYFQF